ncbi:uncharacterized protein TNCV_373241 [Trichonephila clavipes]|nr:uncharacterized protein TNCV_373241 [Trichonephila clavipes]
MAQLLEVLAEFEERYSCKAIRGSRNSDNVERRGWNEHRMYKVDDNQRNWRNLEVYKYDRRFNDKGYQFRNGGQKDSLVEGTTEIGSENFSRGDRKQRGQLNVLKVSDVQSDQTQSADEVPNKLSAICMSPVELPYGLILFNETFTKALWDTGAEKSFISEETYRKYFFISKSIEEILIGFLAVTEMTGEYLTNAILGEVEKNGLNNQNCRGKAGSKITDKLNSENALLTLVAWPSRGDERRRKEDESEEEMDNMAEQEDMAE